MQRSHRHFLSSLALAVALPLAFGCGELSTPTEPSAVPAGPTATPIPTPVPAQPADMSGRVRSYGPLEPGTTVECQGRSTTTAPDGSYSLSGLLSGPATVTVTYTYVASTREVVTENLIAPVYLRPGSNTQDFVVY